MKSAKEEELANMLKDIKNYMNEAELSLVTCSDGKEGIILGNNDKLFLDIDDKLITLSNIMASKFVENIRSKVETLIKQFKYLQELFDEMVLHEANWMYLEPLLSNSSYSAKSLTKETKEFTTCDITWRRIAKTIRDNPTLKKISDDMLSGFYIRTLVKNNSSFEQIKKLLEDYIERKRVFFPRFYFLSNEEILDLLSKAKTLKALEPYLSKLFEQVREFVYDKEQPCGVVNTSGDQLIFKQFSLRPQAEVEEVVKAVEEQIKKNISSLIKTTLPKYEEEYINRMVLIDEFPYQIASITDWILWTKLTE
jgi:dynein heavy chain